LLLLLLLLLLFSLSLSLLSLSLSLSLLVLYCFSALLFSFVLLLFVRQMAASHSERFAAAAPQFGSFHRGFAMAPKDEIPIIDIHGSKDTTVPANVSLSGDGYYYTTTADIFKLFEPLNGGDGSYKQYVAPWDGQMDTYCVQLSNARRCGACGMAGTTGS